MELTNENNSENLGRIIKQRRVMMPLTLGKLATMSGVSASHLGRIERGERFPSASILRKIAKPLDFNEDGLFTLAGYLSPQPDSIDKAHLSYKELDPFVARVLAQEPIELQRTVIGILSILKGIAQALE
jgi:transcriptional regulator with XRE-family HTH domain